MSKKKKRYWLSSTQGVSYTSEYQAILDRGSVLGYTLPSVAQRTKQNQLIVDLKAAGIWTSLDVFYLFATDGNSDFATLNWKAPASFQASKVNSPSFASNQGFTGNASTSYLNTNWTPSTNGVNFLLNTAEAIIHYNTAVTNASMFDGSRTTGTTNELLLNPQSAANNPALRINADGAFSLTDASLAGASGTFFFGRSTNANTYCRRNNGTLVSGSDASTGLSNRPVFLGAINSAGTPATFHNRQLSMAAFGFLGAANHAAFYTAWNTYFTSL